MDTPRHFTYMKALQLIADQSRELATLMPHHGERGRIAEEIIKNVLSRTLPKRFSIGTGVLISSSGEASLQTDIVIFDNFYNSPLLSEFGSGVYPVEIVYATIEVKSVLTKRELRASIEAIRKIRSVGNRRHYAVSAITMDANGKATLGTSKIVLTVPPRSYIVAFTQKGLGKTYEAFGACLRESLDEHDDHVHGVCVLDKNWFAGRMAFKRPAVLFGNKGRALLDLYSSILKGQQNYAVYPMDLDAYLSGQEQS